MANTEQGERLFKSLRDMPADARAALRINESTALSVPKPWRTPIDDLMFQSRDPLTKELTGRIVNPGVLLLPRFALRALASLGSTSLRQLPY